MTLANNVLSRDALVETVRAVHLVVYTASQGPTATVFIRSGWVEIGEAPEKKRQVREILAHKSSILGGAT